MNMSQGAKTSNRKGLPYLFAESLAGTRQGFNATGEMGTLQSNRGGNQSPFNQTQGSMGATSQNNTANLKGKLASLDVTYAH